MPDEPAPGDDEDEEPTHCYYGTLELKESDGSISKVRYHMRGRLGPPCVQCHEVSEVLCDFPIGLEERTCDKPLCLKCAPTVGLDKNFCAEHTAAGAGPNMLLFKRVPTRAEHSEAARQLIELEVRTRSRKKPRLPKAPPEHLRFCVWEIDRNQRVSGWIGEFAAYKRAKELQKANPDQDFGVLTWDGFVAWHRKVWPLKRPPRTPRPPAR